MTDLLHRGIFPEETGVEAWFTLAGRDRFNPDGSIPGLNCGLTSEAPEEAERNRLELFGMLGIDRQEVAIAKQVHSSRVLRVVQGGLYPDTDAFVTNRHGVTLAIQVADCAAILMADPGAQLVAAVHAGWRGAADGIVSRTVRELALLGGRPDRIEAWISPCISQRHFEVGEEVAGRFRDEFVDRQTGPRPHVDLNAAVRAELLDCGLRADAVRAEGSCTFQEEKRYYSWRREREAAGRMLALIRLSPPNEK